MVVEIMGYVLIFIAGTFIGSFLNVLSDRLPREESPFKGRSKCEYCGEVLRPKDLIPVISYLLLKARCRYCNEKLSVKYPIVEVVTGLMFAGIAYYIDVFHVLSPIVWLTFAYLTIVASFLIVIFFADLKYKIIPNKVVIPGIIFVLVVIALSSGAIAYFSHQQLAADPFGQKLLEVGYWNAQMLAMVKAIGVSILSAFAIGIFFYLLIVVTKGKGMGGGDVKLAFFIGLINGFPMNIVAIIVAFVSGALFSLILMTLKRKGMKDVIPFGPFLIVGCIVAYLYGQQIFNWYISLI